MQIPFRNCRPIKDITSEVVDPVITLPLDGTTNPVSPDSERRIFIRGELIQLWDDRYGQLFFDFVPYETKKNSPAEPPVAYPGPTDKIPEDPVNATV